MLTATAATLCLAMNIYQEARSEPSIGQIAVGLVTINRSIKHNRPICKVVYRKSQFSWTNNAFDEKGRFKKEYLPHGVRWLQAKQLAKLLMAGVVEDFTDGADHYYADYIAPPLWSKHMEYKGKWGTHYFYKE